MNNFERPLDVNQKLVEFAGSGRAFALAVILKAEGHAPQKTGVKAIIDAAGRIWGTLGGGMGEAEAQRLGQEACRSGQAIIFDFTMADAYARESGPICGGSMRILIDPNARQYREAYAQAGEALAQRKRGVLLTRVRQGEAVAVETWWIAQEAVLGDIGFPGTEVVGACLADGKPVYFKENAEDAGASGVLVEALVEPVILAPMLLIAGGGHVGQALARLAVWNGFEVTVIDDRPEFTDPALFGEGVRTRCGEIGSEVAKFSIDRETYVVIVTRGHRQDAEALEACIHAPSAYLGMIGSRRKVAMVRRHFLETGLATEEEWGRVFAPVGLQIGAVSVPEIATSIMAEIIAVRRLESR